MIYDDNGINPIIQGTEGGGGGTILTPTKKLNPHNPLKRLWLSNKWICFETIKLHILDSVTITWSFPWNIDQCSE